MQLAKKRPVARKKPVARKRPVARKTAPIRRRRPVARKKGILAGLSDPSKNKMAFSSVISGIVGGMAYYVGAQQISADTPEKKALFGLVGAWAFAVLGDKPQLSAGVVGAVAFDFLTEKGFLNDASNSQMRNINYAQELANVPIMLNDSEAQYLAEKNGYDMNLSDDEGYYTDYYNTENY